MAEFFDPFNHDAIKPKGKVVTINNTEFSHESEEEGEAIEIEMTNFIQDNVGSIAKAIIVLNGPDGEMQVMGFGDLTRAEAIGTLSMAGFALGHEDFSEEE